MFGFSGKLKRGEEESLEKVEKRGAHGQKKEKKRKEEEDCVDLLGLPRLQRKEGWFSFLTAQGEEKRKSLGFSS